MGWFPPYCSHEYLLVVLIDVVEHAMISDSQLPDRWHRLEGRNQLVELLDVAADGGLLVQPSRGMSYRLRPTFLDAFEQYDTGSRFRRTVGAMFDFGIRFQFTLDTSGGVSGLLVRGATG
jgi:hypothetical protein